MEKDSKPGSWFYGKWYVREDFREEPFEGRPTKDMLWTQMNTLLKAGNCFDSRKDARRAANKIRKMFGLELLGNLEQQENNMNEELTVIDDLELAEMAEQEMEIMMYSIPDGRSFEVLNEVLRRFREKLTHY